MTSLFNKKNQHFPDEGELSHGFVAVFADQFVQVDRLAVLGEGAKGVELVQEEGG